MAIKITKLDESTQEICAIRLVGGFDRYRNHHPALDEFRFPTKEKYMGVADLAEVGCRDCQIKLENLIIQLLLEAEPLEFGDVLFEFELKEFSCAKAMEYVLWEVLAQILED